jgi:hypothetical protein
MQPRRRLTFGKAVLGLTLMVLAFGFMITTLHVARENRWANEVGATAIIEAPPAAAPAAQAGPTSAELFLADAYPSRASALRALSNHVVDAIGDVTASGTPARIAIGADPLDLAGVLLQQTISRTIPDARIEFVDHAIDAAVAPEPNTVVIRVNEKLDAGRSEKSLPQHDRHGGMVQLTIEGRHQSKVLTTSYADHRWADDLPGWCNEHPNQLWIIGRSNRPGISAVQARRDAEADASQQLEDYLRSQLQATHRTGVTDWRRIEQAAAVARGGSLPIADRFDQRIHRPYGDIWSEAVLLDVRPSLVTKALGDYQAVAGQHRDRVHRTVGSVAIVLLTILLAYLLLNTITLRYFTGRLRLAAIFCSLVVLVVAAAAIMST